MFNSLGVQQILLTILYYTAAECVGIDFLMLSYSTRIKNELKVSLKPVFKIQKSLLFARKRVSVIIASCLTVNWLGNYANTI